MVKVVVRNVSRIVGFDSGEEFSNLIFVYVDGTKYALPTMEEAEWGEHMFIEVNELLKFVNGIKYLLEHYDDLKEKIKKDCDPRRDIVLDKFSGLKSMMAANAIIENARVLLPGLEDRRIELEPEMLDEKENIINTIRDIASIEKFDVPTLTWLRSEHNKYLMELEKENKDKDESD